MPAPSTIPLTRATLHLCLATVVACAIVPGAATAEVLDKELSLRDLVTLTAIGCGSAVSWLNRWVGAVGGLIALVILFQFCGHLTELHDKYVGPALRAEAPAGYVELSYAGPILVVGCHAAAIAVAATLLRRRRRATPAANAASAT